VLELAPELPVIVMTGLGDHETALQALREGAQDYLVKGQDGGAAVARTLRYAVERSRRDRERRFLVDAGEVLASSLDHDAILYDVARLTVPALADWCVVDLLDERGALQSVKVVAADPAKEPRLNAMLARFPHAPSPPSHPVNRVLASGQPLLVPEVTPEFLADSVEELDHFWMLQALGPVSAMFLPLVVRDQALGAVTLVSAESRRRFARNDLWLAGELARRAALAIENARLYRRTRAAVRAREDVLGIVAHDLRNPLAAITMIGSLLLEERLSPEQRDEQIRALLRESERMDRLFEDLLDVARLDAGTLAVEPEATAPDSLVADALRRVEHAARNAAVTVWSELEPSLPAVRADRGRILQVFSNLLGNAIRHTPRGTRVRVRAQRLGNEVLFTVADDGPGIPPEQLPHLFEPFWQARPGGRGGAGLGLSISRGIAEAHGGRIWAGDDPGGGAVLCFTIPLAEDPARAGSPGVEPVKTSGSDPQPDPSAPIRVLLVDDHPAVLRGARSILAGAEDVEVVGEAATGEHGIALAERLRPDVVVMDLQLPDIGGTDATRILTRSQPGVRVIALSADSEESAALPVLEAGGHGFVSKSTAHEELLPAIRSAARDEVFLHGSGTRALLGAFRRAGDRRAHDPLASLSEHERRILTFAAEGYTAAEIGKKLFLSPSTVASYRSRGMRALGLRDRASLVRLVLDRGLLPQRG
jgi:signal transduction histidine kinase/DNA-binding NarL/FixJ family response regulator